MKLQWHSLTRNRPNLASYTTRLSRRAFSRICAITQPAVQHTVPSRVSNITSVVKGSRADGCWTEIHLIASHSFLVLSFARQSIGNSQRLASRHHETCTRQIHWLEHQVSQLHFTCKNIIKETRAREMTSSDKIDRNYYIFRRRSCRHGHHWDAHYTPSRKQERTGRYLQSHER
jgi:hypothetical protein